MVRGIRYIKKEKKNETYHMLYIHIFITDPEEFLNCLLSQVLKVEPLLKLSSGQDAYFYQLFVEKEEGLILPTVQHLFERSFLTSGIKLKEVSI